METHHYHCHKIYHLAAAVRHKDGPAADAAEAAANAVDAAADADAADVAEAGEGCSQSD